jgi:hypothetical protein
MPPETDFQYLTSKDFKWLELAYRTLRGTTPNDMIWQYWIAKPGRRQEHEEVGSLRDIEEEIRK